jgi:hypothetical protein
LWLQAQEDQNSYYGTLLMAGPSEKTHGLHWNDDDKLSEVDIGVMEADQSPCLLMAWASRA